MILTLKDPESNLAEVRVHLTLGKRSNPGIDPPQYSRRESTLFICEQEIAEYDATMAASVPCTFITREEAKNWRVLKASLIELNDLTEAGYSELAASGESQ